MRLSRSNSSKLSALRFWQLVTREDDGCWTWHGPRTSSGYGRWDILGSSYAAHHAAALLIGHPLPKPARPTCGHRACVNPAHWHPEGLLSFPSPEYSEGGESLSWGDR